MATREVEERFVKERKLLDTVYELLTVGQEVKDLSTDKFGDMAGITHAPAQRGISVFVDLGILSRRLEYGTPGNGMSPGRHYHYTLVLDRHEAFLRFDSSVVKRRAEAEANRAAGNQRSADARRGRKVGPNKSKQTDEIIAIVAEPPVAIATSAKEETRAIAGEVDTTLRDTVRKAIKDAANGPDHALALVEAVRQYDARTKQISAKVDDLARLASEMGVTVDTDKVMESMSFKRDPDMELLKLMLPYISKLESRVERLGAQIHEQREKLNGYDQMRTDIDGLRRQNQRLIASRSGAAAQA